MTPVKVISLLYHIDTTLSFISILNRTAVKIDFLIVILIEIYVSLRYSIQFYVCKYWSKIYNKYYMNIFRMSIFHYLL